MLAYSKAQFLGIVALSPKYHFPVVSFPRELYCLNPSPQVDLIQRWFPAFAPFGRG